MSNNSRVDYPIAVEIYTYFKKGDEIIKVSCNSPISRAPTHDDIVEAMAKSYSKVREFGYELISDPQEFMNMVVSEIYGVQVHVPVENTRFRFSNDDLMERTESMGGDDDEDDDFDDEYDDDFDDEDDDEDDDDDEDGFDAEYDFDEDEDN